uniref:DDE-1 domain-containing protein n=1 Tax=Magallana gigas TaxID=29159 RepID=A0A8W8P487_MAGGI
MEVEGTQRVPIIGLDDKRQVTVVFAGTLSGDFLAPQVIYQGNTSACHPEYDFPLAWNITHSPNWANTDTQMEYSSRVLVPHMDKTKKKLGLPNTQKSLCIFGVFRAQMSREFVDDLKTKNIEIVYIPLSTTDKLQPMDFSIQKVVKDEMKQRFQRWYASCISKQLDKGVDIETLKPVDLRLYILKPLGAKWLVETYNDIRSQTEMVIKGFEKAEQRRKLTLLRSECLQEHKRDGCVEKDQTDAASRPSVEYIFRKAKHFEHFHHIYGLVRDCKTRVEKLLKNNDPAYQMPKDVTVKIGIVGHHTEDNVNLISKRPGKSQLLENQCIWGALPLVCFENESSSKSKLKENTLCQEGVCHKIFIRSDTFCDKADRDEDEDDDSIISVCQDKDQIQDIITSCLEEPLQKMLQQLRKDLKHGRFLENASDIIGEIEAISNELIPINSKDTDVPISGSKSIVPDNVKDFLYGRSDVNSFGIWNNSGFKVFVRKTTDCKELKDELIKLNKNFFQQYDLEIEKMKTEMLTLMREDNVTGALTGFVTKTNNNQKMYALTCNHLFPIENGMAYTHDFEEIGVCVFTARDKGCDFAAIEIKESYSDSCDVAFRKDDKKKTNANVYSDSLDIVHKIGATTGVTNGIIVSPYNHIFPSKNEHACTRHFENVVACVPTTKTNGCDFAAVEIKECYSNSCDVAFVKDNKKKLNANLYSNSLQTGGSVHKKEQEQIDVTNGRIVRPEFYLKATDKSNQENTFLLKGMAEKFSERGDSGSLVF